MAVHRGLAVFGLMWGACLKRRSTHGLFVVAPGWDLALLLGGAFGFGSSLQAVMRCLAREALLTLAGGAPDADF